MGEYKRPNGIGGWIRCFTPDNDRNTLYLDHNYDTSCMNDFWERIQEHFGSDIQMSDLTIGAEHIHTDCLGYGSYDSGDWTNYIVIRRKT